MKAVFLSGLMFICSNIIAQSPAPSAEEILAPAYKKAAAENKNVIIIFHASWCGWCKKMDASMNDPLISKYFDDNYVTVHLTVEESAKNKQLENEGAAELKKQYHGEDAGLPFFLIMNKNRELLADSYILPANARSPLAMPDPKMNTGCPAEDNEVAYFIRILGYTSHLDSTALAEIAERFKKNKAAH